MAGPASASGGASHGLLTAFMYIFNLVVGTGVLALPSVLIKGGWVLGTAFLLAVASLSYISATFVIEAMAAANAVLFYRKKRPQSFKFTPPPLLSADPDPHAGTNAHERPSSPLPTTKLATNVHQRPSSPLPGTKQGGTRVAVEEVAVPLLPVGAPWLHQPFDIVLRTEMGEMAELFFNTTGRCFFYLALIVYLLGDVTIYATFIPKSMIGVVYGDATPPPAAFDGYLALFVALIGPFCFFDLQKTKLLQLTTIVIRNAALFTIIGLALRTVYRQGTSTTGVPDMDFRELPNLFGGAVYAFMCHHSLPSMITPMKEKSRVTHLMGASYIIIFLIYFVLFISTSVAFGTDVQDPITFNFPLKRFGWMGEFLLLFPVFTLSSSFPIIIITLRNNLDIFVDLILPAARRSGSISIPRTEGEGIDLVPDPQAIDKSAVRRVLFTLLALVPPIALALIAEHTGCPLDYLVGYTGAYAGVAVMFVIPAALVYCSRLVTVRDFSSDSTQPLRTGEPHPLNHMASPFRSVWWVVGILAWSVLAWVFNTADKVVHAGGER